jgi:hypothetical protein
MIDESFECELEGSGEPLTLGFQGQVVGPTFYTDVTELLFGPVAFGFPTERVFTIFNTSPIELNFKLRLPEDLPASKEITLHPAQGTIRVIPF